MLGLKFRKSWLEKFKWIKFPIWMNKHLLKNACLRRWKKQLKGKLQPKEKIINPNCLKVLKAIIFFPSISKIPDKEAKNIVVIPNKDRKKRKNFKRKKYFKIIKIPAVTKVLEWTKALTGVGALIAKGNQVLKGIWADFVKEENKKINKIIFIFKIILLSEKNKK